MAPHTITHCANDDISFLRESRHSRDIKYEYRKLMNNFLCNCLMTGSLRACTPIRTIRWKKIISSIHFVHLADYPPRFGS